MLVARRLFVPRWSESVTLERRRCHKCRYELTGGSVCPECGTARQVASVGVRSIEDFRATHAALGKALVWDAWVRASVFGAVVVAMILFENANGAHSWVFDGVLVAGVAPAVIGAGVLLWRWPWSAGAARVGVLCLVSLISLIVIGASHMALVRRQGESEALLLIIAVSAHLLVGGVLIMMCSWILPRTTTTEPCVAAGLIVALSSVAVLAVVGMWVWPLQPIVSCLVLAVAERYLARASGDWAESEVLEAM